MSNEGKKPLPMGISAEFQETMDSIVQTVKEGKPLSKKQTEALKVALELARADENSTN